VERGRITGLTSARAALAAALDFTLPPVCAACDIAMDDGEPGLVCGRCWNRLEWLPAPQCQRCGHPLRDATCGWCALIPPYVRCVRSVCWTHTGTGSSIIHALKYGGWHAIATGMAQRMARLGWPRDVVDERTAVIAVPLAESRRRERGFNQSACLAAALAARWDCASLDDALERTRATTTQTRLTPEERLANVSGAFRTRDARRQAIRGAHVVLVDDVVTTAATLNACAAALMAGGARIVSYVTFGRAPASGDR